MSKKTDDFDQDAHDRANFAARALGGPGSTTILTPEEIREAARAEYAARELSRRRLLPFIQRFNPSYEAGWVHKDICTRLEKFSLAVVRKESPRLMLFMPPRHGKSEIASRNFPAWHLGRNPTHEIIATSYSGSLALKFSRKVRSLFQEPAFPGLFQAQLDPKSQAAEAWTLTAGGGYMCAGVSGPLTGNGMHVGIIDDPVKNREEAESENTRSTIKDWYTSTFYTRLAPGAGILIILTRWHHDDLAGWLLEEQERGGDVWEKVVYPAVAEEDEAYRKSGEALHPERYDLKSLARIRRAVGPRDWQALYQQQPSAAEGDYFKRNHFRFYNSGTDLPPLESLTCFSAWDFAIGKKEANDWTVGITVGVDAQDRIWVLDVVRERMDALEICEALIDSWKTWRPQRVGMERGQIFMSILPLLKKILAERKLYEFPLDEEGLKTGKADKQARARSIQGRARQGKVYLPQDAAWLPPLLNELLSFPNGVHDDQVDALAWIGIMLNLFYNIPIKIDRPVSWRDKLNGSHGTINRNPMGA